MAVYGMVTAKIAPGKWAQAMEWAQKMREHVKTTRALHTRILANVTGDPGVITWLTEFDSLAHFDEFEAQNMTSADYQALLREMSEEGLFADLSISLYRVVA